MKRLLPVFLLVCAFSGFAKAQCGGGGTVWYDYDLGNYDYCDNNNVPQIIASHSYVATQIPPAKLGPATGSLTNSALGCASTTVSLTGATTSMVPYVSFTGASAVPSGLVIQAQVTSSNTVTVSICSVISLSTASRAFSVIIPQ